MKTQNTVLRLSVCLAVGGLITIAVICFMIGFGFHSAVGKYAVYTALFLQMLCLGVNYFTDKHLSEHAHTYTPSKKMARFRLIVAILWIAGALFQALSLGLVLLGLELTNLWVRILCTTGVVVCPFGWAGILLASHRRRSAIENILAKKSPKQGVKS